MAAGCLANRSAVFVPTCDEDAPSRLEVEASSDRMDATLYAFEERGWSNVTNMGNGVAGGDCPVGTRQAVLFDWAGLKAQEEEAGRLTRGLLALFVMLLIPGGTALYYQSGRHFLIGNLAGTILAYTIGLVPFWVNACVILANLAIIAVALFLKARHKKPEAKP